MAFGKALKGWVGNNHRNLGWWFWSKNHVNKSREVGRPGLNDSFWVELRVSKWNKDKDAKSDKAWNRAAEGFGQCCEGCRKLVDFILKAAGCFWGVSWVGSGHEPGSTSNVGPREESSASQEWQVGDDHNGPRLQSLDKLCNLGWLGMSAGHLEVSTFAELKLVLDEFKRYRVYGSTQLFRLHT